MNAKTWARVALGLGLLGLVLSRADLDEARRSLARADGRWIVVALLAQVGAKTLWAWRWSALLRAAGWARRTGELFGMVLVGLFFGSFLPSSVGGDVARAWSLASRGVPRATAAASVLADRLVGVAALAVAVAVGAALGIGGAPGRPPWVPALAALAVFAGALALASRPSLLGGVADRLPGGVARRARRVADAFALVAGRTGLVSAAMLASLGLVAFSAVFHWSLARAIGIDVPFAAWLVIVPAVMLLSAIPLTPNGMGIREAGFVGFLTAQGIAASPAALFAVLALLLPLPFTIAGGVLFAVGEHRDLRTVAREGRGMS